jgi:hypothetical protein
VPVHGATGWGGDLQMLQLTTLGRRPSFGMAVPTPTPSANAREEADSGRLTSLPGEGARLVVVDKRRDWNQVFAPANAPRAGSRGGALGVISGSGVSLAGVRVSADFHNRAHSLA